jgi:hypothetical protein
VDSVAVAVDSAAAARRGGGDMNIARALRHAAFMPWQTGRTFSTETLQVIEQAITDSENRHAGELRVVIEGALHPLAALRGQSGRDRAIEVFSALRIWDTEGNNGVLIYLLLADHDIEIVADRGIHRWCRATTRRCCSPTPAWCSSRTCSSAAISASYVARASSQRCVRAGGKHNDLENVGYTARHHTFFEMLGNFSFGDYFKRDAIRFAWEFLTGTLALPPSGCGSPSTTTTRPSASGSRRSACRPSARALGDEVETSGRWATPAPAAPARRSSTTTAPIPGGPPGSPDEDGDRYIEIWNLVFMQFERAADGKLTPLPKPSVDTGMGLERIAAVMQGVHSNYDIDLFRRLLAAAAPHHRPRRSRQSTSLRVIADHIRACAS